MARNYECIVGRRNEVSNRALAMAPEERERIASLCDDKVLEYQDLWPALAASWREDADYLRSLNDGNPS